MTELSKTYDPKPIEKSWYQYWEEHGLFSADPTSEKPPYCIILPPPNVTGVLHMGHALVDTLQDILIRWKRMSGYEALWVPGTDHAGISTQTVVERALIAKTGKRRTQFSREEFLSHVWKWKEENEQSILHQLRMVGCSCDWSRTRFTMDETSTHAVRTMFKKMYDDGLIYQGDYLVNWDPVTQTALADDEVEHEEREGSLWHFRYPIEGTDDHLIIATTRPETMLGDSAVAVSPSDKRYAPLVGKQIRLPLSDRFIPIIEDHYVDPEFGSGAVKITPAHDHNDYEIGLRHSLPIINIMTPDGRIAEGEFAGMSMLEAREAVVARMKELGFLEKIEPHTLRIGLSYRSKAIIEPYLSKQWFVKMSAFKQQLIDAVKHDHVKLIPKNWENTYFHWIENLRDWCISRQLWWGHRIPIWKNKSDPSQVVCSLDDLDSTEWEQDEDVLDTWFSSALWPFSTLGWPDKTPDLARFYPSATLITGHDILFFWVARMMLMGEYALGQPPFPETFLHGLIYGKSYWRTGSDGHIAYATPEEKKKFDLGDAIPSDVQSKWEKMSKSKGNVIDPLEIIETYGADAMRLALAASATYARQIDLDRRRFEEFRNFINKMWNGARFVFMNLDDLDPTRGLLEDHLALEDHWMLSLLSKTTEQVTTHLENYQFDHAATTAYEFFWDQFCAYYVEMSKPVLFGKVGTPEQKHNKQQLLLIVLTAAIRLLHPMAPFITEELFSHIKKRFPNLAPTGDAHTHELLTALAAPACIVAPYPTPLSKSDPAIEKSFEILREVTRIVRNIRGEMQIPPNVAIDLYLSGETSLVRDNEAILKSLIKVESITYDAKKVPSQFTSTAIVEGLTLVIPLPAALEEKEQQRREKEREKLTTQIAALKKQLANKNFVDRAPKELVQKTKEALAAAEAKLAQQ